MINLSMVKHYYITEENVEYVKRILKIKSDGKTNKNRLIYKIIALYFHYL